jgi:hypothetical protein
MFGWLVLTGYLEQRRALKPVPAHALEAKDSLAVNEAVIQTGAP